MMDKITEIYRYYQSLEKDERVMELFEREKGITISKADRVERPGLIIDDVLTKDSIKRYSSNRLIPVAHSFMRIFLHLVTQNNEEYNTILVQKEFATFFANHCKEQYWVLAASIKTNTENVHILMVTYSLESFALVHFVYFLYRIMLKKLVLDRECSRCSW